MVENFKFYVSSIFYGINFNDKNILDIGSGTGIFSVYSSIAGAKNVVSLEPEHKGSSEKSLDKFSMLIKNFGCQNINVVSQKIQDYKPDNIKFDIIILHNTINHLDEDAAINLNKDLSSKEIYLNIFKELKNICNQNCTLIITDCSRHNFFGDLRINNPFVPQIEWNKHCTPYLWKKLLAKSKFKNIEIKWINHNSTRNIGKYIIGNKYLSYFLNSYFLIKCKN